MKSHDYYDKSNLRQVKNMALENSNGRPLISSVKFSNKGVEKLLTEEDKRTGNKYLLYFIC